jgi:hypothetical protein
MRLLVDPRGKVTCVYAEAIELSLLGPLSLRRASWVEPDDRGCWWADLAPVGGPTLGPYPRRSDALGAEADWLDMHLFNGLELQEPAP